MKANEAPEKIYIADATFPDYVDFDGSPINTKRIDDHDIEYTRTNAFEEKAKRYDEAIERAKSKLHYPDRPCFVNVTEIFHELKESEDERIRKAIINKIKCLDEEESKEGYSFYAGDYTADDCIAWLEKQGEQKSNNWTAECGEEGRLKSSEDSCKKSDGIATEEKDMTEYKKGFECGKQRVLKYPEDFDLCKKTLIAWSEEDERMYKEVLADIIYVKNDLEARKCLGLSKRATEAFNWFSKRYKSIRPQNT